MKGKELGGKTVSGSSLSCIQMPFAACISWNNCAEVSVTGLISHATSATVDLLLYSNITAILLLWDAMQPVPVQNKLAAGFYKDRYP